MPPRKKHSSRCSRSRNDRSTPLAKLPSKRVSLENDQHTFLNIALEIRIAIYHIVFAGSEVVFTLSQWGPPSLPPRPLADLFAGKRLVVKLPGTKWYDRY